MTKQEMENIAIIARNAFIVHHLPNAYLGYEVIKGKLFSIGQERQIQEILLKDIAKFINHAIDPGIGFNRIVSSIGADKYKEIVRIFIRGLVNKY